MFVHGDNLTQKENHKTKYIDAISRQYLSEIRPVYDKWRKENLDLRGPFSKDGEDDALTILLRHTLQLPQPIGRQAEKIKNICIKRKQIVHLR